MKVFSRLLTYLICFLCGFFIAKNPRFKSYFVPQKKTIHLYTFNKELLTDPILEKLQQIHFGSTDLNWHVLSDSKKERIQTPGFLISSDKEIPEVFEIRDYPSLNKMIKNKIHPDFLTKDVLKQKTIPLFWKTDSEKQLVFFLGIPISEPSLTELEAGMDILLNPQFQRIFLDHLDLKTTLVEFENSNLDPNKKASALRFVPFKK